MRPDFPEGSYLGFYCGKYNETNILDDFSGIFMEFDVDNNAWSQESLT